MLEPLTRTTLEAIRHCRICVQTKHIYRVANLQMMEDKGINGFIPFKPATRKPSIPAVWNKAYHFFNLHREEFLQRYHARSNAESTFQRNKAEVWRQRKGEE